MATIVRTPLAEADLEEIWSYIARDNPAAADKLVRAPAERVVAFAVHAQEPHRRNRSIVSAHTPRLTYSALAVIDWAGLGVVVKEPRLPSFGLVVAYLLPGFTAVWGAAYLDDTLSAWLLGADAQSPTVGGFLYVTIASLAAGMAANTARWLLIDTLLRRSGVPCRRWDFSRLQRHIDAYSTLTEHHYRHYQFYGGMLIALTFVFVARRFSLGLLAPLGWPDVGFLLLSPLFAAGAYDTFHKYYSRLDQLLDASTKVGPTTHSFGLRQAIRKTSARTQTDAEPVPDDPRSPAYTR